VNFEMETNKNWNKVSDILPKYYILIITDLSLTQVLVPWGMTQSVLGTWPSANELISILTNGCFGNN